TQSTLYNESDQAHVNDDPTPAHLDPPDDEPQPTRTNGENVPISRLNDSTRLQQKYASKHSRRKLRKKERRKQSSIDEEALAAAVTAADEEWTVLEDSLTAKAKADTSSRLRTAIDSGHSLARPPVGIFRSAINAGHAAGAAIRRLTKTLQRKGGVKFATANIERTFQATDPPTKFIGRTCDIDMAAKAKETGTIVGMQSDEAIRAAARRAKRTRCRRAKRVKRRLARVHQLEGELETALQAENEVLATFDSGADNHYVAESDRQQLALPILRASTKRVRVANGEIETGKHRTMLPIDGLSEEGRSADSFDQFGTTLLSVGRTTDDGNTAIFNSSGVSVHRDRDVLILVKGKPVMIGRRDDNGRYKIPLVRQRQQMKPVVPRKRDIERLERANSVYDLPSVEEAIKWMHAACGYPVKSTWLKAIKAGNFHGWPLLSVRTVKKYYPETTATDKGHLNQTRKNVRSTRPKEFDNANVTKLRGKKKRDIYVRVFDARETIFSDQTGAFPKTSQRKNKYVMVMVEIDSNAILVEPMKSRGTAEMQRAYEHLLKRLKRAGFAPKKHVLDNEVSEEMKEMIRDNFKLELELVPPGCHRRNAAEVAIRNFKAHFLSILAGAADDFPLYLWDRLLPQAEITLNLLRQSNSAPNVSAYAHLSGPFDYNKMPLAPMGCKVQVHEKTDNRGSWAYHSVDGWYLSHSPEHYRTANCHIKTTRAERLSDTVQYKCKNITNPTVTVADKLMKAIGDCQRAINNVGSNSDENQLHELDRLMTTARRVINTRSDRQLETRPAPRVEGHRVTRSMSRQDSPHPPRVDNSGPPRSLPRVARDHAPRAPRVAKRTSVVPSLKASTRTVPSGDGPAMNTRSRTRATLAMKTQRSTAATGPAMNTRSRTKASGKVLEIAAACQELTSGSQTRRAANRPSKAARKLAKRLIRLDNEIGDALAVLDQDSGKLLNYRQLLRDPKYRKDWMLSAANEFGRLAQGVGNRIKGTDTMTFIRMDEIPKDRLKDVTYLQMTCSVRPEKKEPNRTRAVVGGDRINYPGDVGTPTAEMLVAKLLFNSVVSTKGARFMTMDISNFYLNTPMPRPEYIRTKLSDIPDEIIDQYNLRKLATADGSVYMIVTKGMYGLPQAGKLANELLEKRLNAHGYRQSKLVPGLWKHDWRPIQFTLVVDDFGVKYVGKEHAEHLASAIRQNYKVTEDWTGNRYIGITLDWDYDKRQVHLSMPGYTKKALKQFGHKAPKQRQNAPYPHTPPNYGARKQYAKEESTSPPLDKKGKRFIQQVCGKFLYYGRAVDSTLLMPISAIASQQANPTEETMRLTMQLLDYIASQDEAIITYSASDMVLAVHSDASYLSEPQARSRAGGHFFLSTNGDIPPNNGAILNIAHLIKHVMSSATEAELAALYIMAREAVFIRIILDELGHKQPATPIQTDNAAAEGVVNRKVQPKRTKAMDMRFHWLRDRECQEQFRFYWRPGKTNYADYWTKHHAAKHHSNIRREFITPQIVLETLRAGQIDNKAGLTRALARV
ncbi:hypothetical protein THAOC_17120, partial [Thalassiosira oceanica]